MRLGRIALASLLTPVVAAALDVTPGADALERAVMEGQGEAAVAHGYDPRNYLLYAVADARTVLPEQGSVDAIVLLTPLERLRHAAYLQAASGQRTTPLSAAVDRLYVPHEVGFRVFAHGTDAGDTEFTQRFAAADLRLGDRALSPKRVERSSASLGRYPLATNHRERTVGTVTYWFDGSEISDPSRAVAILSFRDAEGRAVDLEVDLGSRQ